MSEMEQDVEKKKDEGHAAIVAAIQDLGKLGYRVSHMHYQSGHLDIGCYCPQPNEGSKI